MLVLLYSPVKLLIKISDKLSVLNLLLAVEEDVFVLSINECVQEKDALDFI